ncbi:hypothetical protein EVAR_76798_1 [Eumeta japonica]|uniref:Uncharacterized protein n=1 Tax=Eumeta variegata TaxID=151549 RepID=A0A4C1SVW3_EUMVA|nr:hypothetical protein EVAR_76798_1 [Eumeta japonica]
MPLQVFEVKDIPECTYETSINFADLPQHDRYLHTRDTRYRVNIAIREVLRSRARSWTPEWSETAARRVPLSCRLNCFLDSEAYKKNTVTPRRSEEQDRLQPEDSRGRVPLIVIVFELEEVRCEYPPIGLIWQQSPHIVVATADAVLKAKNLKVHLHCVQPSSYDYQRSANRTHGYLQRIRS